MKRKGKIYKPVRCFLLIVVMCLSSAAANGDKKVTVKLKAPEVKAHAEEDKMSKGSFMVASQCEDCNKGYTLEQVDFFGFDKKLTSSKETFFITNHTDRELRGITLYITYLTPTGQMLDKRFVRLSCRIPAGETRKADIDSFDTQKSFYYIKSDTPKRRAAVFDVEFDLVAFYLSY